MQHQMGSTTQAAPHEWRSYGQHPPVANPARTPSNELSRNSKTRWCSPRCPVLPMYMPGRLRTGSRPCSTCMVAGRAHELSKQGTRS